MTPTIRISAVLTIRHLAELFDERVGATLGAVVQRAGGGRDRNPYVTMPAARTGADGLGGHGCGTPDAMRVLGGALCALVLGTQKPPQQFICLRGCDLACSQQDAEAV